MTEKLTAAPDDREPVLVVDDEPCIRDVLSRTVDDMGHEWEASSNGDEALEALHRRLFALVLSDIRMPGMDGVDLLRCVVADCPHTAIIMVTAVSDVETAVSAMRLGACDYIVKPFNLDDVARRIERAFVMVSSVVKVLETMIASVSSGSMSLMTRHRSAPSTLETKCEVISGVAR